MHEIHSHSFLKSALQPVPASRLAWWQSVCDQSRQVEALTARSYESLLIIRILSEIRGPLAFNLFPIIQKGNHGELHESINLISLLLFLRRRLLPLSQTFMRPRKGRFDPEENLFHDLSHLLAPKEEKKWIHACDGILSMHWR